jgi:hypothetical protein
MADTLSYSLRSTFAKEFFQSLTDPISNDDYYMFYGRAKPWSGNTTPTTVDTIKEQNEAKRNILFYQKIISSDVSLVAPRYDWTSGIVYDQYEDDVELWKLSKKYYVLVQEGDEFGVFICLSNNGGSPSTASPSLPNNGSAATQEIITSDGYVWKYLYTLTDEMEKFLTSTYMPVVILDKISYNDARALALAVKLDADNGSIQKITINTTDEFTNLVNPDFSDNSYSVTSYNSQTLTMTASVGSAMSSVNNFYNTNYVVFFENGKIGTIDSYTVSNGVATIVLCEVYPDDATAIQSGDVFSILPKINIKGNGTGAVAVPVFQNNILTDIIVMNGGQNYNFAETFFLINTNVSLSAVIPPDGGHGFDILGEIKPTSILISKDVSFAAIPDNEEKYFGNSSFLRQIGIVKNIETSNGTNPNNQTNQYDMVLKYNGSVSGTSYGGTPTDYTLPNWGFASIYLLTPSSNPVNEFNQPVNIDDFYQIGNTYTGKSFFVQNQNNEDYIGVLVDKKINWPNNGDAVLYFESSSSAIGFDTNTFITNQQTGQKIKHQSTIFTKNIYEFRENLAQSSDVYYHVSNFRNDDGQYFNFYELTPVPVNTQLPSNQITQATAANFFTVGDVIQFFEDSTSTTPLLQATISEIIVPGIFGYRSAYSANPGGQANMSTTLKLTNIVGDLSAKTRYESLIQDNITLYCGHIQNLSKTDEVFEYDGSTIGAPTGEFVNRSLNFDSIFNAYYSSLLFKDKEQILIESEFDVSNYLFPNPQSAPATAPTHILGNDTLSTAKIESFSVDPLDPTKLNLKITSPSGDYEPATITTNQVTSGESVTLFRRTPSSFTNTVNLVEGNTQNLYVLSENYDVSAPANIPETIISSVVSKYVLSKDGSFGEIVTPVGSYLYREPTETKDSAAGFVISQDLPEGTTTKTKNIYVQMEKGTFDVGDILICVSDPFVKNVTLFNNQCAGNTGVSPVTVSVAEQKYNNININKYSGEVLYIQNIDPVQLSTDTNFTTNILLGF